MQACLVGCHWESWGSWGQCSVTCGRGTRIRVRAKQMEEDGGKPCEGLGTGRKDCSLQAECSSSVTTSMAAIASGNTSAPLATASGRAAPDANTEFTNSPQVTGDLMLQVTDAAAFMGNDKITAAMVDFISALAGVRNESIKVELLSATALLALERVTQSGIVDVRYSINMSLVGNVSALAVNPTELARKLSTEKLPTVTFMLADVLKKHHLTCLAEAIGFSAAASKQATSTESHIRPLGSNADTASSPEVSTATKDLRGNSTTVNKGNKTIGRSASGRGVNAACWLQVVVLVGAVAAAVPTPV